MNPRRKLPSFAFNRAFSRKAIETCGHGIVLQHVVDERLSIEHSAERQLRPDYMARKRSAVVDFQSIEHSAERQLRPVARERFPPVVCGGGGAIRVEPFGCAGALRTCRNASLPCKELPDVLSTVGWLCFAVDEWRNKILWVRGDWTDVRRCPNALLQTQTMR